MLSSHADSRRLFGNEFQDIGPVTAKARRPNCQTELELNSFGNGSPHFAMKCICTERQMEGKWSVLAKCGICKERKVQGKLESAWKGNCKEWNLEGNGSCKEQNLQGLEFAKIGICKEWNLQVTGVR